MTDILFYHLTSSSLETALPPLLEKSLERGWTVRVTGNEKMRLDALDRLLWTYRDEGFLPHGRSGGAHDADQPILLTEAGQAAPPADVLMLIDGAMEPVAALATHQRVCLFFDGNDPEAVQAARGHWKTFRDTDFTAKYWAQEDGRWVAKA